MEIHVWGWFEKNNGELLLWQSGLSQQFQRSNSPNHMRTGLNPSCSTSNPAPRYASGKAAGGCPNLCGSAPVTVTDEAHGSRL